MIGKLISQGASRSEVLGAARSEGVRTGQIENVQVSWLKFEVRLKKFKLGNYPFPIPIIKMPFYFQGERSCWECKTAHWAWKWTWGRKLGEGIQTKPNGPRGWKSRRQPSLRWKEKRKSIGFWNWKVSIFHFDGILFLLIL